MTYAVHQNSKLMFYNINGLIVVLVSKLFQNYDFSPLRKILQNWPLSFATVAVLAPKGKKIIIKNNTWHIA